MLKSKKSFLPFMAVAAIFFAIALYFTSSAIQAANSLKTDNTPELKSIHGLSIASAVTAWIAYVLVIVAYIMG